LSIQSILQWIQNLSQCLIKPADACFDGKFAFLMLQQGHNRSIWQSSSFLTCCCFLLAVPQSGYALLQIPPPTDCDGNAKYQRTSRLLPADGAGASKAAQFEKCTKVIIRQLSFVTVWLNY
jgi:hypothetical protein